MFSSSTYLISLFYELFVSMGGAVSLEKLGGEREVESGKLLSFIRNSLLNFMLLRVVGFDSLPAI